MSALKGLRLLSLSNVFGYERVYLPLISGRYTLSQLRIAIDVISVLIILAMHYLIGHIKLLLYCHPLTTKC